MAYDNIKSHTHTKKQGFTLSLEDTFFERPQEGGGGWNWPPPAILRLKVHHANWKATDEDRLRVSKVSWKCCILTIYNFAVIYLWNLLFS